jgi:hypothetical protein
MADWDWVKTALQAIVPLVTGTAGLFLGTWQAGKRSGKQEAELEAKIKADLKKETDDKIEALRNEMRTSLAEATEGPEEFIKSIGDTFTALRTKINDVERDGLIRFLPKDDFTRFLEEYRKDQRRTDDKLEKLLALNGASSKS